MRIGSGTRLKVQHCHLSALLALDANARGRFHSGPKNRNGRPAPRPVWEGR